MIGDDDKKKPKHDDDSGDNEIGRRELRQMFMIIEDLHAETKKFWRSFVYWFQRRRTFMDTRFKDLDLKKVLIVVTKVKKYLNEKQFDPDNDDFGRFAKGIRSGIMQ